MSDGNFQLTLAKWLPSWVATALYAVPFGLALAVNVYIQESWVTYALAGWTFGMTYLFVKFYRMWANLHNVNAFKDLSVFLGEQLDGTFMDETCLTEGDDEEERTSTDGE